ncbi:hypothetical protein OOU_Y34scaffold00798g1 [Pyricularia oryzae Y34]|uniref:Uncharacterized protein n=2 Tax=Pyricularia oryzae TaxID=318829 RepID=A0AA97NPU6_PYRO3|nr:hypothetical protein OOU_Y34scaffold00798g1 [Pyricularia oryzae Y34]
MKLSLNGIVALLATTAAAFPLIEDDADMIKSFPLSRRQVDKVPRAAIFHAFNDTDCKSFEMEARFEAPRPELKNRITCVNLGNAQVASLKALFLKDGCSMFVFTDEDCLTPSVPVPLNKCVNGNFKAMTTNPECKR